MAALNFPSSPSDAQIYTDDAGRSFRYNSAVEAWFGLTTNAGGALLVDAQYDGGSATAAATLTYASQRQVAPQGNDGAKNVFLDATQTLQNKTLKNATLDGASVQAAPAERVYTITDGASVTLDPRNGPIQFWTLGANRTAADGFVEGSSMTLFVADGTAFTLTITGIIWVGGVAPTLATSGYSIIELFKANNTLYGSYVGDVSQ